MDKKQKEIIKKIREWIKENALCQTTYSNICWDDGNILFKRTETKRQGDWCQEAWDRKIAEFKEEYIDYEEFVKFLDSLEDNNGKN